MDKEVIKYRIHEAWIAYSDAKFSMPIHNVTNRLISDFVFQMIDRLMEFTGTDVFLKRAEELHDYAMLRKEELALAIRPRDVERFQQYIDYLKKSDFERYNEPKFEHGLPFILTVEEIKRLNDKMKQKIEDPAETDARIAKIRALPDEFDELYDGGVPAPRFRSSSHHIGYVSKAESIKSGFLSRLEFFPSNPRPAHFAPVNSTVSKAAESHSSSVNLNPSSFRPANMISSVTSAPSGSGFWRMDNKNKEKTQSSSKEPTPISMDETWEKTSNDNFSSASLWEKWSEERGLGRSSRAMGNIEIFRDVRGRSVDSNAERSIVKSMAGLQISRGSRGKSVDRSSQLSRSGVMDKIRKISEEVEKKAAELAQLREGKTVDTIKDSYQWPSAKMVGVNDEVVQKAKEKNIESTDSIKDSQKPGHREGEVQEQSSRRPMRVVRTNYADLQEKSKDLGYQKSNGNTELKHQSSDGKSALNENSHDARALADIRKKYEDYLKTLRTKRGQRTKENIKNSDKSAETPGEVQGQSERRPIRIITHNYHDLQEESMDSNGQSRRRFMDKMESKSQSSVKKSALDENMYEGPTLQAMRKLYAAELENSEREKEQGKEETKDNSGISQESSLGEGQERSRGRLMKVIRQSYADSAEKLEQRGGQNIKDNVDSGRKIQQRSQSLHEARYNKTAEWVDKSSGFFDNTVAFSAKSNIPKELNEYDLSEWDTLNSVETSFNNEKKRFEGWEKEELGGSEMKGEENGQKNGEIRTQKEETGPKEDVKPNRENIARESRKGTKLPPPKEPPLRMPQTSPICVVRRPNGKDVITNNPKYTKTHRIVCEDIFKSNYRPFFSSGASNRFGQSSSNKFGKPEPIVIKNVDLQNIARKNENPILPKPAITGAKKVDAISPKSPAESLITVSTINMHSNAPSPRVVRGLSTFAYTQDPEFVYAQWSRILILCGDDWPSVHVGKSLHPSTFIHRLANDSTLKQLVRLLRKFEYSEKVKSIGITANNHWIRQAPGSWGLIGDVFQVIQVLFPMALFTMTTCFNTNEAAELSFNKLLEKKLAQSRRVTLIDMLKEINEGNLTMKKCRLDDNSAQKLYCFMLDI